MQLSDLTHKNLPLGFLLFLSFQNNPYPPWQWHVEVGKSVSTLNTKWISNILIPFLQPPAWTTFESVMKLIFKVLSHCSLGYRFGVYCAFSIYFKPLPTLSNTLSLMYYDFKKLHDQLRTNKGLRPSSFHNYFFHLMVTMTALSLIPTRNSTQLHFL